MTYTSRRPGSHTRHQGVHAHPRPRARLEERPVQRDEGGLCRGDGGGVGVFFDDDEEQVVVGRVLDGELEVLYRNAEAVVDVCFVSFSSVAASI